MSDIKRVVLTTLEPQKSSDKVVKKHFKTVRICVALPESNEDKCPEYNYKDEVAAVKKKGKQQNTKEVNNVPNGLDPLDPFDNENDDDVRRIAIEMEAKYGTGVSNPTAAAAKKRRKGRKDDYADIGAGYDENDSFIDNTDGYDEIIPPNVTTARGGFYINSGALEFKEDNDATSEVSSASSSDEEESDSEEEKKEEAAKPRKKRALDTTDEEDAASDHNSKEQEEKVANDAGVKPNISMQQAIKKKLFSHDKIQVKKRKLLEQQKKTVKNLLDERRTDSTTAENVVVEKECLKENKKPMRLSSVEAAINSVIGRMETSPSLPKIVESKETKSDTSKKEQSNKNGLQHSSPEVETVSPPAPAEIVKLPESLPADIIGIIENIKKAARDYKDGGKVKFFSGEVNVMLLNLERKCKVLGRSSRVRVYEHLAPFVKCRKETLVKRAKNLVIEDEQKKLKMTIDKLKCQIDQLMPSLLTNHELECQKVLQRKFSPEAANNEELKNLKAPRRRFPLSDDMRRMIREIVNLKKRCFIHEGKDKNALEDHLTNYLKKDILPVWPEGWMSMAVLKKFCTMSAIKTPDPKSLGHASNLNKHSQKSQTSSAPSTIINLSSGSNLTITPVNLTEKLSEVRSGNSVGGQKVQPDMVIKPVKEKEVRSGNSGGGQKVQPDTVIKPVKEKSVEKHQPETIIVESKVRDQDKKVDKQKDNGVIVINTVEPAPVIPKATTHCQVIDLTDSPFRPLTIKPPEDLAPYPLLKAHAEASKSLSANFEQTIKQKFPGISVTTTNAHDKDDVQKVMESLKALQKLSSPSKNDSVGGSPVSVIAFNKNYSNSGSGSQAAGSVGNERTNFSGAIGYQDEFQKQFISSLNNHRSPPAAAASTKPNYNRCS